MGKKKRCEHITATFDKERAGHRMFVRGCYAAFADAPDPHFGYGDDAVVRSAMCVGCGELLSLGPSNETEPLEVCIEFDAAWYASSGESSLSHLGSLGWAAHRDGKDLDAAGTGQAGWLARELATHDDRDARDATAWPWDPTRAVAGQGESWLARTDRLIEAMEDDAATQFEELGADPASEIGGGAASVTVIHDHKCDKQTDRAFACNCSARERYKDLPPIDLPPAPGSTDDDAHDDTAWPDGASVAIDRLLEESDEAVRDAREQRLALDSSSHRQIGDTVSAEASTSVVDDRFDRGES